MPFHNPTIVSLRTTVLKVDTIPIDWKAAPLDVLKTENNNNVVLYTSSWKEFPLADNKNCLQVQWCPGNLHSRSQEGFCLHPCLDKVQRLKHKSRSNSTECSAGESN